MTLPSRTGIAATILAFLLPREDVDAMIGDLEEERASRAPGSHWYWAQVLRSIPVVLWLPIHRDGWLATCGVALTACALQIVVELITGHAIQRFAPMNVLWPSVVAGVVTLASLTLVSFEASRIRRGAATVLAGVAVCTITLQLALASQAGRDLRGGALVALIVAPGLVLTGGFLTSRTRKPGEER